MARSSSATNGGGRVQKRRPNRGVPQTLPHREQAGLLTAFLTERRVSEFYREVSCHLVRVPPPHVRPRLPAALGTLRSTDREEILQVVEEDVGGVISRFVIAGGDCRDVWPWDGVSTGSAGFCLIAQRRKEVA